MPSKALIWVVLSLAVGGPLALAAQSELLQWRDPVYIGASFAGIAAMGLFAVQPLLPGMRGLAPRRLHRVMGPLIGLLVLAHVGSLWLTSPPDVIDALLFASPTPFSVYGVVAMWAVLITAILAVYRKHLGPRRWRRTHAVLVVIIIGGTIPHVLLIDGTLALWSKTVLSGFIALSVAFSLYRAGLLPRRLTRRRKDHIRESQS